MARINVEDKWWTDIRRSALIRFLKDEERADGAALRLWRAGFEYWKNNREPLPKQCFELLPCASELLASGLAVLEGDSVYVKGASEFFNWIFKKAEAGRKGGRKSVESRLKTDGTAQPMSKQDRSRLEAPTKQTRSKVKHAEPSSSSSSSSSIKEELKGDEKPETAAIVEYKNGESKGLTASTLLESDLKIMDKNIQQKKDQAAFIAAYITAYQTRYGEKARPVVTGKIVGEIKNLLKTLPVAQAVQLIQVYCQMDTDWFKTKSHDITTFISNLNLVSNSLTTGAQANTPGAHLTEQQKIDRGYALPKEG